MRTSENTAQASAGPSVSGLPTARPSDRLVADSWRRSLLCGLARDGELALPFKQPLGDLKRLNADLHQVVKDLDEIVSAAPAAVVVSDRHARIVHSGCRDPRLSARLAEVDLVPGFLWEEQYAGTTGIGIAIETRRPATVVGAEHFNLALSSLTTIAAPIVDPISRRVRAVLGLVCWADSSPAPGRAAVKVAVDLVEQRLRWEKTGEGHELLASFLAADRRAGVSLLAFNESLDLANRAAAVRLEMADRTILRGAAERALADAYEAELTVELSDGRQVSVKADRVGPEEGSGLLVRVGSGAPRRATRSAAPGSRDEDDGFIGSSTTAIHLRAQAAQLARQPVPVFVSGEPGTGKTLLAEAIAARIEGGGRLVTIDAAALAAARDKVVDRLEEELEAVPAGGPCVLIVLHIDRLPDAARRALKLWMSTREGSGPRLVATCETETYDSSTRDDPDGVVAVRMAVPPLREHVEDLLDLVPHFLRRINSRLRFSPEAMQALLRCEWPGNAREVEWLVGSMAARATSQEISLQELPTAYQAAGRRLGRLEHVERAAVVLALREADGNKSKAAEILGIGRATLYRKMRTFGLATDLGQPD